MNKLITRGLALVLTLVLLPLSSIVRANTVQNNIDQHKPVDMNNKQWSSLKTAVQEVKLLPSAGGGEDHNFGNSVSVDGNRMVVGAPNYSLNTIVHGAVYVFDFDGTTWTESQILTPFDGNNDDQFGISVSLSGTQLLIGANKDDDADNDAGVVFVYNFDGVSWQFTQKLIADDAQPGYKFGGSLSLSGNRALIGSDKAGESISATTGAAYIFEFNNNSWTQTDRLLASDGVDADNFGVSVSLFGNRALIGNSNNDDNANGSGSAYIFDFDGTDWLESQKLTATNAGSNHQFGSSVSLSSNTALIGATGENTNGGNSGAAYVFNLNNNTWTQSQKILATDGQANAKFGNSVSLMGNRALITAVTDTNKGAAYVFNFNGNIWSQSQKLTASDASLQDQFGFAAGLTNDRLVIGAHFDDSNGDASGSVYVFDKNGSSWSQKQKLIAESGTFSTRQRFGLSVSLSNDRALIGTPSDNSNGSQSGTAYVFDFDGTSWNLTTKLSANDGEADDLFGASVSLSGNRALIGALGDDDNGVSSGAAYVFDFDGNSWNQITKLTADDGEAIDLFGNSVSLSDNRALIGAYYDENGSDYGAAYVYDFDGNSWSQTTKLSADDGESGDHFGNSVSLSGNRILIGAPYKDAFHIMSGVAYIFDFNGSFWSESKKLTASDTAQTGNFFGGSVSLSGNRALVGVKNKNFGTGSAYLYHYNGENWSSVHFGTEIIRSPDPQFEAYFGNSVSIFDDRILIGAQGINDRGLNSGSAYIFTDINDLIFENGFEN